MNSSGPTTLLKVKPDFSSNFSYIYVFNQGWHSKINRLAGRVHLNLWYFIELLKKEEMSVRMKCAQIHNEISINTQKAKYRKINDRLRSLEVKLVNGHHDYMSFLSVASNLLC